MPENTYVFHDIYTNILIETRPTRLLLKKPKRNKTDDDAFIFAAVRATNSLNFSFFFSYYYHPLSIGKYSEI